MKLDNKEDQKRWDSFKIPKGWEEVFPDSPMNWSVFDEPEGRKKQGRGSRQIIFHEGYGHCLVKK